MFDRRSATRDRSHLGTRSSSARVAQRFRRLHRLVDVRSLSKLSSRNGQGILIKLISCDSNY